MERRQPSHFMAEYSEGLKGLQYLYYSTNKIGIFLRQLGVDESFCFPACSHIFVLQQRTCVECNCGETNCASWISYTTPGLAVLEILETIWFSKTCCRCLMMSHDVSVESEQTWYQVGTSNSAPSETHSRR